MAQIGTFTRDDNGTCARWVERCAHVSGTS